MHSLAGRENPLSVSSFLSQWLGVQRPSRADSRCSETPDDWHFCVVGVNTYQGCSSLLYSGYKPPACGTKIANFSRLGAADLMTSPTAVTILDMTSPHRRPLRGYQAKLRSFVFLFFNGTVVDTSSTSPSLERRGSRPCDVSPHLDTARTVPRPRSRDSFTESERASSVTKFAICSRSAHLPTWRPCQSRH